MDTEFFSPPRDLVKCCNCGCSCSFATGSPGTWIRSVKRKYEELEDSNQFHVPGLDLDLHSTAKVQIETECELLRETVSSQQQAIQDLYAELDEERNAASTAANEAMSMILRLQREKAEIQMEARQFKSFAEEKMAHDNQELLDLEDLLYKREQTIQAMTFEIQAYKHRMMSYGLTEAEAEGGDKSGFSPNLSMIDIDGQYELPLYDYPPLKCNVNENPGLLEEADIDVADVEQYPSVNSPHGREHLKSLEHRISQMERRPSFSQPYDDFSGKQNVLEKVVVGQSPRRTRHSRRVSNDSSSSALGTVKEIRPECFVDSPTYDNGSFKQQEGIPLVHAKKNDDASETGDDTSDRICTIDSVHKKVSHGSLAEGKLGLEMGDDYVTTPREFLNQPDVGDPDLKKLYMRLQALEADRESMRQVIHSMQTEKAQFVLLKEIAQHLSKEVVPERRMPVHKASIIGAFSFMSIFKWVASFVFWKRRARRSKYMHGMSSHGVGMLMLLDKGPRPRQWRCLTSTQV